MEFVRPNLMKRKLKKREPVFDVRITILAPELVEIAGAAGVDTIWIDGEHSNFDWDRALACVLAAELHGITPILRPTELPGYRAYMIQRALDLGFQGVWVTGVRNPEEMRSVLDVIKFPPEGRRGVGEGRVFEGITVDPAALRALNQEIFVAVMIETAEALAKIDEICSLQGIDAVGLGHRDYALDAGLPDFALDQPGMQEALGKVNAAAKRHGKARYGSAVTPKELQQSLADGALLFSLDRETKVWERTCSSVQALKTAAGL